MSITVTPTYSPYIADIVAKKGNHEMEPIAWGNPALTGVLPEQDLLTDQRHHDGVVHVVVGRVTIGDILQREATNETNDVWIGRLEDSVDLAVLGFKLPDKRLDDDFSRIEHGRLCSAGSGVDADADWRLGIASEMMEPRALTASSSIQNAITITINPPAFTASSVVREGPAETKNSAVI